MKEVFWLTIISGVWLFLNVLTADRSPTVWMDEVMFVDPAVSQHLGQGFTSTAWYGQTKKDVFAGYPVLYQLLLIVWLKCWDLSITSVRSLGYILVLGGVWLMWLAIARVQLITRLWSRVCMFVMLLTGYGMTFVYRCGRVESLLILLCGAAVLASTVRKRWWRLSIFFAVGAATSWSALHAPVFAASVWLLALWFRRGSDWQNVLSFGTGGALGLAGFLAYVNAQDPQGRIQQAIQKLFIVGGRSAPSGLADPSMLLLWLLLMVLLVWRAKKGEVTLRRSVAIFSLVAVVLVPVLVWAVGRYPIYYSWMAWVLLVPGLFQALDMSWDSIRNRWRTGIVAILIAGGSMGLPARLALTVCEWKARDYKPVEELVRSHVNHGDWVFTDYGGYYAVKPRAAVTATEWFIPAMSEGDKRRLTWMIVAPANFARWSKELGGEWVDTGFSVRPDPTQLIGGAAKYDLTLYRQVAGISAERRMEP